MNKLFFLFAGCFPDCLAKRVHLSACMVVFRRKFGFRCFVELILQIRYEFVQFMQVDIGKDWRYDSTLRCTAVCGIIFPVLHISSSQEFPYELCQPCVLDFFVNKRDKDVVVYVVETTLDVTFDEPFCPGKVLFDKGQCRVAASFRSESVGILGKDRFIDGFKDHSQCFLHQFVGKCWQSQWTLFLASILFVNIHSAHWFGFVTAIFERFNDFADFFFAESISGIIVHTRCGSSVVCVKVFVRKEVHIGSQQVSEQLGKDFIWMVQ